MGKVSSPFFPQFPGADADQDQRAGVVHNVAHDQRGRVADEQADEWHQRFGERKEHCRTQPAWDNLSFPFMLSSDTWHAFDAEAERNRQGIEPQWKQDEKRYKHVYCAFPRRPLQ